MHEQISAFQTANPDVEVEFRLKKAQDVGGIMSTLRAASLVAPGALPDLTLLRRSDVLAAAQAGLIMPMDDRAEAPVLDNLHPMVARWGTSTTGCMGCPTMSKSSILPTSSTHSAGKLEFRRCAHSRVWLLFSGGAREQPE